LIQEFEPCEDNIDVRRKEVDEGRDVQIAEPLAKPTNKKRDAIGKKIAPAKKRATKVKVKGEDKKEEREGEKKKNWLDNKVEYLIALRGEKHLEFEKNAKEQGIYSIFKLCQLNNDCFQQKAYAF
jgi:hypothetical protein